LRVLGLCGFYHNSHYRHWASRGSPDGEAGAHLPRGLKRPTGSLVIPALDAERSLPHVAERTPHEIDEIVFVNGGRQM
jgi:hypothetical protein